MKFKYKMKEIYKKIAHLFKKKKKRVEKKNLSRRYNTVERSFLSALAVNHVIGGWREAAAAAAAAASYN